MAGIRYLVHTGKKSMFTSSALLTGQGGKRQTRGMVLLIFLLLLVAGCHPDAEENAYTGVVEATTVQVPALTGGKILQLLVDTGQSVEKEQVLAQTDTTELVYQLEQLRAGLEKVRASRELAQTHLRKAQNDVEYLREKLHRFQELYRKNSIPEQTLDDIENRFQAAEIALQAARQQFQQIDAEKKQLEARLKTLRKKIRDATVRSPLSGIVSAKYYEEGEVVPPGHPVVEVMHLDKVWVKIYLSEKTLPEVRVGQTVEVRTDGLEKSLQGRIAWISPKAEFTPKTIYTPETRTSLVYAVKVNIDNPDQVLKQGMPVEILLPVP